MGALRGGSITKRPLCLSQDGKVFFAPCGSEIRIYSAVSGELLAKLQGHTAAVTAVAQDPSSPQQLYSSGRDGTLRLWNHDTGALLRTYNVEGPVESLVVSRQLNVAYVSLHPGQAGRVAAVQLPSGELLPGRFKVRAGSRLYMSPAGTYVAAIDQNSLFVWSAGSKLQGKPYNLSHIRPYTCAAMDAHDRILAAGDVSGRILIWHNFADVLHSVVSGGNRKPPACTTVHWHAHPVGCLAFSNDSSYLMSGGQEAVLVQWNLGNNQRTYLPRLGGPLTGITPNPSDEARILVSQADNVVRVINLASKTVECSVMGLRPPPPPLPTATSTTAVLQPITGHLVLPCDNATLQFFDATRDRHVGKLQVAPRNPVAMTDAAEVHGVYGPPAPPQVTLLTFGPDARCLTTVDVRPTVTPDNAGEATLSFWDRSPPGPAGSPPYMLNTRVNEPHRGSVAGLAHHPSEDMVASCSEDGEFKLWVRTAGKRGADAAGGRAQGLQGSSWRCASVGSYRNQPLGACAFSSDGSLLAVATGTAGALTLWQPYTNTLVARLAAPPVMTANGGMVPRAALGPVMQVAFLTDSPHVVATTAGPDAAVIVWDLLTVSARLERGIAIVCIGSRPSACAVCSGRACSQRQAWASACVWAAAAMAAVHMPHGRQVGGCSAVCASGLRAWGGSRGSDPCGHEPAAGGHQ